MFFREHPLVVKAKSIVCDFEKARQEDPLISGNFHARCALRLNCELIRLSNLGMDGLKVREAYYLINQISMMVSTQQLRITAAGMAANTKRMQALLN